MKKNWRYFLIGLLILVLAAVSGFFLWAMTPAQPETRALDSLQNSPRVQFSELGSWLVFTPEEPEPTLGLILYPGGRVDHRAYAPHAHAIASQGFIVIIVPMPLNLAFLGINRADDVIQAFPEIDRWAVGGHSLGGAMAAEYVSANPDRISGLVLWASYPGANNDLSRSEMSILSVYASQDGLATFEDIANSRERLPASTTFFEIPGGNHAGFGWYGEQSGDGEASLSKSEQQDLIVGATAAFLQSIGQ
jgi:hypothetical protein